MQDSYRFLVRIANLFRNYLTIGILKGEFTMKDLRNPIERRNFTHPAGNTMTELKEAELNNFAAGAGEPRNSGGMFCTSTGECNMGTLNIFCC